MRNRPQLNVDYSRIRASDGETAAAQKKRKDNEFWARVLPMVGTAAGAGLGALGGAAAGGFTPASIPLAVGGASIGSGIGGALGGAAGAGFQNEADSADDSINEKNMRQQALLNAIMMMRR